MAGAAVAMLVLVVGALDLTGVIPGLRPAGPSPAARGTRAVSPSTVAGSSPVATTPPSPAPVNVTTRTGIATTLSTYYQAINAQDYRLAWRQFSLSERRRDPYHQFSANDSSTIITVWTLRALHRGSRPGTEVAYVTFTSHQSPAESPDHRDSCDTWRLDYTMISTSGHWLIEMAAPHYPGTPGYTSCG